MSKRHRKNRRPPVKASVSPPVPAREPHRIPISHVRAQMFESAQPPRRLQNFFADATDEYADTITHESVRQEMRANARKVYVTEGCTSHGTFTLGNHCVGTGPLLAMIPPNQRGRLDSDISAPTLTPEERAHIEYEWFYFSEEIDLNEHLQMAVKALQFDGELFFRMVYDPEIEDVNLNLLQIEARRVRFPLEGAWREDMVGGIQFEGMHPKSYYILPKCINPALDWNWNAIQVPASEVLHFAIMCLPDQHRAIPWMQTVLNDIAETQLYEGYHLGAANAAARNSGGVVECDASIAPGQQQIELQPVYSATNPNEIKQLLPGLRYKQNAANWPASAYNEYIDTKREKHAAGMHVTKAMLTGNFEKHSYSSFRGEIIVYWELIKYIRSRLAKLILDRLFNRWLECLSAVDDTAAQVVERFDFRYKRIPRTWTWSPIPSYDLSDTISALKDSVAAGFMSRKMAVESLGYDFERVEQERREDTYAPVI